MTYHYDAAGRLTDTFVDGFSWARQKPDGTAELHKQWTYDDAGHLTRFTQDGTTAGDNPYVDGKPDLDLKLADARSALLTLAPAEVFRFPAPPSAY